MLSITGLVHGGTAMQTPNTDKVSQVKLYINCKVTMSGLFGSCKCKSDFIVVQ